ncbi:MAG: helix-turn-helix transcriptional regulator [Desulfovibrionaceae bacterium]|nr:helix-turn-helix transcriptional regulator [Desulfovibrionaceae bacterium]
MQSKIQIHTAEVGSQAIITLSVPAAKADMVADAIRSMLTLAGHKVHRINSEGEEVVSAEDVFPEASPAMALRGFRGKMEWSQQELAEKLGTTQNCISAMESGKRHISVNMAKRLGKVFNISYKAFL